MAPIKEWFGLYNVIYNWFEKNYGYEALEEYWMFIAENCFEDVVEKFKDEGLDGIRGYYEHIFNLDEGECKTYLENGKLTIEVNKCPDYEFMKSSPNPHFVPIKSYCKHHEVMNNILADKSGHTFCMCQCDNNGHCKWMFTKKEV
ncbi:MAG TPA: hypothetical protein PK733_14060 [Clostridiales bacterium]|nr:hypothetical protein [Clostridiales bacterium]